MQRTCLAVVLAAGDGTRMKSSMSKVLHPVAGRPMILHVLDTIEAAGVARVALVTGRDAEAVADAVGRHGGPAVETYLQTERLGTAHAVLAARPAIEASADDVLVLFGDTPLVTADTIGRAREALRQGADVAVIGFRTDSPTGYGRLLEKDGELVAIREEKDATAEERAITFCNGGVMAIAGGSALRLLDRIGNENAKGEFYLTDIVETARDEGRRVVAIDADGDELIGVNTRAELAMVERLWQERRRHALMQAGVTMIAPETVFLSADTEIAADVTLEPNVVFGTGVRVGEGAVIHAFCHIAGATIGPRAEIGPFARLRPGAMLSQKAKVGNFCEVKQATIGEGAKVNHLTYIGDAEIGAGANIGAGTITCNYDGLNKHLTRIGAGVFIGSNTSLVAPVSVADNAYVASGSVITDDVPADALAFGRARQETKPGYAARLRERIAAFKASAKKPE